MAIITPCMLGVIIACPGSRNHVKHNNRSLGQTERGRPLCYVLCNKANRSQGMLDITHQSMHWLEWHTVTVRDTVSSVQWHIAQSSQGYCVNSRQPCDSCVRQPTVQGNTDNYGSTDMVFIGLIRLRLLIYRYLEPIYIYSKNNNISLNKYNLLK